MIRNLVIAAFACVIGSGTPAFAALTPGEPLQVRILFDNSGSMYPGYTPPGTPGRRTRAELGARFYYESPQFQQWLADFVAAQSLVDGDSAGMWTFTSNQQFTPADVQQVHPTVPIAQFNVQTAIRNIQPQPGQNTYLAESLDAVARDFTGLVWLITDNIVETTDGQPDVDVQRFFQTLNDRPEYRSVHLFKYPFSDEATGQHSALAVYGILVSAAEVPPATLAYYDRKFRTVFRNAKRQSDPAADLFAGREHLKLKNLSIDSLELRAALKVILDGVENGVFKEGQTVHLGLDGEVRSNLTQHSVIGGRYDLAIASPFTPEEWAARSLGAQPLSPDVFEAASGAIDQPIPPNGTRAISAQLQSNQPISFSPATFGEWLRLAWSGATVRYTGNVRMSFTDVKVQFKREQMAGIFGIDHASNVFDFQDVGRLDQVNPSVAQVSFALRTGSSRSAILLALLAVLAATGAAAGFVFLRPRWFRVRLSGTDPATIPLRRLGVYPVLAAGQLVGRLGRGLGGGYDFRPVTTSAAFKVTPGNGVDTWDIHFAQGPTQQLSIEPRDGKRSAAPSGPIPATGVPPPRVGAAPPRTLPKIDRP